MLTGTPPVAGWAATNGESATEQIKSTITKTWSFIGLVLSSEIMFSVGLCDGTLQGRVCSNGRFFSGTEVWSGLSDATSIDAPLLGQLSLKLRKILQLSCN